MLVIWRDPRGVLGKDVYELDCALSLQENIARLFPKGLDANTTSITLNGSKINPLEVDLSRLATHLDHMEIVMRQQGTEVLIGALSPPKIRRNVNPLRSVT